MFITLIFPFVRYHGNLGFSCPCRCEGKASTWQTATYFNDPYTITGFTCSTNRNIAFLMLSTRRVSPARVAACAPVSSLALKLRQRKTKQTYVDKL